MATLADLLGDVYRRLGFAAAPDPTVAARLTAYLNETQQEILSEPGMEALLNDSVSFASVASTPEYSLPQSIARVKSITETTNRINLTPLSSSEYRARYPDPTAVTGTPDEWVDLGFAGVAAGPSDASELFFKSSSASDDNTKKVFLEGYTSGGAFRTASVAMNGVTAVSLGASITTWISVTKFYIALAAAGNAATTAAGVISLLEDSGIGTTLAQIPIGQSFARYRRIALAICPSAAITYTVNFERDVPDLSVANDQPILPPRFHRLLAIGARMKEYEKQDDSARYDKAEREFDKGMKTLKFFLYSQAAGSPNLRGSGTQRPSQLGANFPSGS